MKSRRLRDTNKVYTSNSGTTTSINYSVEQRVLEIEYRNKGRVYFYYDVPLYIWRDFVNVINAGGSSGVYVNTKIKGLYDEEEVT